jgi:hypothetical protein
MLRLPGANLAEADICEAAEQTVCCKDGDGAPIEMNRRSCEMARGVVVREGSCP